MARERDGVNHLTVAALSNRIRNSGALMAYSTMRTLTRGQASSIWVYEDGGGRSGADGSTRTKAVRAALGHSSVVTTCAVLSRFPSRWSAGEGI